MLDVVSLRGEGPHGALVETACERLQHLSHLAQRAPQQLAVGAGQLSDGADSQVLELAGRSRAHIKQFAHGGGPDHLTGVVGRDDGEAVGLVVVAAELGEDLVPADADRDGDAQLADHALRYLARHEQCLASLQVDRAGEVEPGLVEAEGLHEVGVLVVDLARQTRVTHIEAIAWRHHDGVGTGAAGLPQGGARLDATAFGWVAGREHDAMAALLVAAHDDGKPTQLGALGHLDRCVEAVHVHVQHYP